MDNDENKQLVETIVNQSVENAKRKKDIPKVTAHKEKDKEDLKSIIKQPKAYNTVRK
jgi:hypothetical protein